MIDSDTILSIAIPSSGAIGGFLSWYFSRAALEKYKSTLSINIEKTKNDLTKDVETLKNQLCNRTYTSKVKFDIEFVIYRELFEYFFEMVKYLSNFFANNSYKERTREQNESLHSRIHESSSKAHVTMHKNAPFIKNEIFYLFVNFYDICDEQCKMSTKFLTRGLSGNDEDKCFDRALKIANKFKEIEDAMRTYISNMEII